MVSDSELPIPDLADFSIRNPQFTEIRVDLLAGCPPYRCLHEPGDVQCRLGLVQPLDARHRLRMLGYEHRAAVLVRQNADVVRFNTASCPDDVFFIVPDQRPENRELSDAGNRSKVFQRLACYLAQAVAGHQPLSPFLQGQNFGYAHHEASVQKHAKGRWRIRNDLALQIGKRDQEELRFHLIAGKNLTDATHLFLRFDRGMRKAVKMNEEHSAAATHHAIGGYRRINAARPAGTLQTNAKLAKPNGVRRRRSIS